MRHKVTVVGVGNVGSACAQMLAERGYADVVLVDIIEGMPQGKSLDLQQAGPIRCYDSNLIGTNNYEDTANSDVVVITSGVTRRPGMSRDDLVLMNMRIVQSVTEQIVKYSPKCILVMVTNPVDAMAQLALQVSKFPRNRVLGMSVILDTARFRSFVARELGVSVEDVSALILGEHGDRMVSITRLATVGGVPLSELMPKKKIDAIAKRTVEGGSEIIALLKTGSAFYAPAACTVPIVDSIILDRKRVLPCSAFLEGEYGISGVFVGVPLKLGKAGIEKIIEVKLMPEEIAALQESANAVMNVVNIMKF